MIQTWLDIFRKYGCKFVLAAILIGTTASMAQYPVTEFVVIRTRSSPGLETYNAVFNLQVDWSQVDFGSNSTARLSHSISGHVWSATVDIVPQDDHGYFPFDVSLPTIADANGDWTFVLDPETAPEDPRRFTITDLTIDQFPPYHAWPQFGYEGDPHQVLISITNSLEYQSGITFYNMYASCSNMPWAKLCIYSNGGPYRFDLEHAINIGPLPILDADSNSVGTIDYPFIRSEYPVRFCISDEPGELSLSFDTDSTNGFLICHGLIPGQPGVLRVSTNLMTWSNWMELISPATVMYIEPDRSPPKQYFMLAQ